MNKSPLLLLSAYLAVSDGFSASTKTDTTWVVPSTCSSNKDQQVGYPSPLHSIHLVSLLSDDQSEHCVKLAKDFAAETGCWTTPDSQRHSSYPTCDFPIDESPSLTNYLNEIEFDKTMWGLLSERYGVDPNDMSYLDFFCVRYAPSTMDRLEAHRDGSLLSFSVLLNPPSEFTGGGIFFDALRDDKDCKGTIRPTRAGDACLHSGKLLHGGDIVTAGERIILVGFVEVADWCQRSGVLSEACKHWGRMDVATARYKRQQTRGNGWLLNKSSKWLKEKSCIRGYCPAFSSVVKRADEEYQRQEKLKAEDVLLRTILLSPGEASNGSELYGGDITIL
jgi:hypothetical protein